MSVNVKQLADGSVGLEGVGLDDGQFVYVALNYQAALGLVYSAVMPRAMVVKSITLSPDVAATNAVTISCFKAPTATALGSGTVLHTGTLNCQGTAGTNLPATLSATTGVLNIAATNKIGFVISGATGAAGSGTVTFGLNPA